MAEKADLHKGDKVQKIGQFGHQPALKWAMPLMLTIQALLMRNFA